MKEGYRNPTGFRRWVKVAKSSGLCYTYAIGMMKSYTTYHIGERYSTYLRKHFWKKYIAWMQKTNLYDFSAYGAYIVREEE